MSITALNEIETAKTNTHTHRTNWTNEQTTGLLNVLFILFILLLYCWRVCVCVCWLILLLISVYYFFFFHSFSSRSHLFVFRSLSVEIHLRHVYENHKRAPERKLNSFIICLPICCCRWVDWAQNAFQCARGFFHSLTLTLARSLSGHKLAL